VEVMFPFHQGDRSGSVWTQVLAVPFLASSIVSLSRKPACHRRCSRVSSWRKFRMVGMQSSSRVGFLEKVGEKRRYRPLPRAKNHPHSCSPIPKRVGSQRSLDRNAL